MTIALTHSEDETVAFARQFAGRLRPGSVVLLVGDLGAGKTAFVRGLAIGLGIDPDAVSSPTFTLIQEYRGAPSLWHVDLYRLQDAEIPDLGLDELTSSDAIVAIEWAEKIGESLPGAWQVRIEDRGGDDREIVVTDPGGLERRSSSGGPSA